MWYISNQLLAQGNSANFLIRNHIFPSHTNVTSVIVSPFTYIESCSVYGIDVKFTTYKYYALGSSMLAYREIKNIPCEFE